MLVYYIVGYRSIGRYRVIGRVRLLAQILTYEGVVFFALVALYAVRCRVELQLSVVGGFLVFLYLLALFVGVVMERRRSPVDFVEGESELVSGLATEFGGLSFRFLFILEYGSIGVYCFLVGLILFGGVGMGFVSLAFILLLIVVLNWLRMRLPRARYDNLMEMG